MSDNMRFIPKPFVFYGNIVNGGCTPVGQPDRTCHINPKGDHECVCVHFCEQFLNYPTIAYGIRYIPKDAKCEFTKDGKCSCDRLVRNGKIKRIKPHWLAFKVDVMRGLTDLER